MTATSPSLRLHGDSFVAPGALDFAVNVWPAARPEPLERALSNALAGDRYPNEDAARSAVAARHARDPAEVLLTNGACEAFWLIAHAFRPLRAACVHPGFTEPEAALRASGADVVRVFRDPQTWKLHSEAVPRDVDLVVLGNPDNPTGALEPPEAIAALTAPDRLLVVDESFMDFVPGERESVIGRRDLGDIVVVRSLTKIWSLAAIRAGYIVGPATVIRKLETHLQPWSVNALACAALEYCAGDSETPTRIAADVASLRATLHDALSKLPFVEQIWPGSANFLLLRVKEGPVIVSELSARGIAVRPAETFPGLGADHLRVAVRPAHDCERLLAALWEIAS